MYAVLYVSVAVMCNLCKPVLVVVMCRPVPVAIMCKPVYYCDAESMCLWLCYLLLYVKQRGPVFSV